jgi:hypothetical protein
MYEGVTFQDIDDTVEKVTYMHTLPTRINLKIKNLNVKNVAKGWKMVQFVGSAGKLVNNLHSSLCR